VGPKAGMNELKKWLLLLELVAARQMPLDEARRRRTEILRQSRRGRLLLRIERAEHLVSDKTLPTGGRGRD
jgi:hypothetical protein